MAGDADSVDSVDRTRTGGWLDGRINWVGLNFDFFLARNTVAMSRKTTNSEAPIPTPTSAMPAPVDPLDVVRPVDPTPMSAKLSVVASMNGVDGGSARATVVVGTSSTVTPSAVEAASAVPRVVESEDFGYFEGITQIDGSATGLSASWPQIEFLADILLDYPNATFVLTRRNESNWANSAQAFDGGAVVKGITTMSKVSAHAPLTSLHNTEDLAVFAAEHTQRVRRMVLRHRVPHYIEVDIEHPAAGEVLAAGLPTPQSSRALKKGGIAACWKQTHVTEKAEPPR